MTIKGAFFTSPTYFYTFKYQCSMTPFEYVTVLISIILGLGITQIVTGIADIIHQWERVKLYWPHLLWILLVFFLQIQEWWQIYDLREYNAWRLPTFLLLSLYPVNLFILSRILFPISMVEVSIDFKQFYFDNYRKFFLMIIVNIFLSLLEDLLIQGYALTEQPVQLSLLAVMLVVTMTKPKAEWIHKTIVVALVIVMLASMAVLWNKWLISS